MTHKMLAVMWKIKDPVYSHGKSELHVLVDEEPDAINIENMLKKHIEERYKLYNENSAEVIGVKVMDYENMPTYMIYLQEKYPGLESFSDVGQSCLSRGLMIINISGIAQKLVEEEGFQDINSFKQ